MERSICTAHSSLRRWPWIQLLAKPPTSGDGRPFDLSVRVYQPRGSTTGASLLLTWSKVGFPAEPDDAGSLTRHQHPLPEVHLRAPTHGAARWWSPTLTIWRGRRRLRCRRNHRKRVGARKRGRPVGSSAVLSAEKGWAGGGVLGLSRTRGLRGLGGRRCLGRGRGGALGPCRESREEDEEDSEWEKPIVKVKDSEDWRTFLLRAAMDVYEHR